MAQPREEYWPSMLLKQVWPQEGREARPVVVELADVELEDIDLIVEEVVLEEVVIAADDFEGPESVLKEVVLEVVEELDMTVEELQFPN